jgi:hypothetical protein
MRNEINDAERQAWQRTGSYATADDSDSALLQLPDIIEMRLLLDTEMVQYDAKKISGYLYVVD